MTPLILLCLGLLLIFVEFYLPGAVMGITGGVLLFASMLIFALESDSIIASLAFACGVGVVLAGLIKFALWRIRTTKPSQSIYSADTQDGFQASSFDGSVVGKKGIVDTDLRPGGYILIDGKRLQALSQSGYLTKGTEVLVIGGQEESLIVKHITKDKDS